MTVRPLGLHQITAMELAPVDFVEVAIGAGCDGISVFTFSPNPVFPTVTHSMKHEMQAKLAANGVSVLGVEFFPITAECNPDGYVPGLALGRELGASHAVTHILDIDDARIVDRLGALCELASREELRIGIEFTPLTRGCDSIMRAAWLVDQVGQPNLGIGMDCLHFVRSGGKVDDLARLESRYFCHAQICDGHGLHVSSSYMNEAHDRELPGDGSFPLDAIIRALPASTALEVEAPSRKRREAGVSAFAYAREAVARARALVNGATPSR